MLYNVYLYTDTSSSPEDNAAAVNAFNDCRPQLEAIDPEAVTRRLVQTGILSKDCDTSYGAAVQLPDEVKRQLIWTNIGKAITVSGAGVFHKLTTILSETPHCFDISNQLNGLGICWPDSIPHTKASLKIPS